MAIAAIIFMLLAIFYYEYVPPGAYDEKPEEADNADQDEKKSITKAEEAGEENAAYDKKSENDSDIDDATEF